MTNGKIPFRLGVTGGIGSGKTSVCRVFRILGIPVFSADSEAGFLMENDRGIRNELNAIAGRDLFPNGKMDRAGLAKLIFNDREMLDKVNKLVHPAVFESFRSWTLKQNTPYVIMEAAILFESGAARLVDEVLTVTAPIEERIERVMQRNKLTREQVLARIRMQMDDDEKISLSHYIIRNSENEMIIPSVLIIHENILKQINS